jgi:hypothetical protein
MTKLEFYKRLEEHDWQYAFSDDDSVYWSGKANYAQLCNLAAQYGYFDMLQAYERHEFIRDAKGAKTLPKPKAPDVAVELVRDT